MKKMKQLLVLMLTLSMIAVGCAGKENTDGFRNAEQKEQTMEEINIARKYREEQIELPQDMPEVASVLKTGEQSYRILGIDSMEDSDGMKILETTDNGVSWQDVSPAWFSKWKQEKYIISWALAPDKSVVLGYADSGSRGYLFVTPDGEKREMTLMTQDGMELREDNFIRQFAFSNDNKLFAIDISSIVYQVDVQTGKMKKILDGGNAGRMNVSDNLLIVISSERVSLYDTQTGTLLVQDSVLEQFVYENADVWTDTDRSDANLMIAKAKDNALYIFGNGGIYRHVIGGTAMELILDGSSNSLAQPNITFLSVFSESDSVFVLLTADGRMLRYTYDEHMEIKEPEEGDTVRIYSLREDTLIQWAVSLYQKEHPDKKVIYEIGMTPENGVTREDAIKNFNTALLGEEGPDIIVLDDLQQDSLLEKGVLKDVSDLIVAAEAESPLLPNIKDAYITNGAIYAMPCKFQVPMAAGDEDELKATSDLVTLADSVEQMRLEKPEGALTYLMVPEQALGVLTPICMGSWITEDGALDEEALLTFFESVNRIYKAETMGLTEEERTGIEERSAYLQENRDTETEQYFYALSGFSIKLMTGESELIVGNVGDVQYDLADITSSIRERGSGTFALLNGQEKNVFLPRTVVAMNSGKESTKTAEEFFKYLFSEELQTAVLEDTKGFSVNQTVFDRMFIKDESYEDLWLCTSDEKGNQISLQVTFPSSEDAMKLKEIIETLDKPAVNHAVLKDAVYEAGVGMLKGEIDEKTAVREVSEKMSLYLAE